MQIAEPVYYGERVVYRSLTGFLFVAVVEQDQGAYVKVMQPGYGLLLIHKSELEVVKEGSDNGV